MAPTEHPSPRSLLSGRLDALRQRYAEEPTACETLLDELLKLAEASHGELVREGLLPEVASSTNGMTRPGAA